MGFHSLIVLRRPPVQPASEECDDYKHIATSIRRPFDCLSKVNKVIVT